MFFLHHLWKMDGAVVSQSCIWLRFPLLTWGSVVIFAVTCNSCLGPSNQVFTKEKFEVKELQRFLPQKLEVTPILKPGVGDCQVKKVENCTHCPFPIARGHPVETQHSVNQVHTTHVGVVLSNCQWPWHLNKPFVFLGPSFACVLRFNAIGRGCHGNWLVVQPLYGSNFRRASSDYHLWCPSSCLFEGFILYDVALLWQPVFHEGSSPCQPFCHQGVEEVDRCEVPVKEQVGSSGNRLYQMKNSLLSNALPFCNSEGSLALLDHKV